MRILIVRLSALGDQIHLCPALSDIKAAVSEAEIHWAVQPEFADIAALHSAVYRVHRIGLRSLKSAPLQRKSWGGILHSIAELRRVRFDLAIDAQGLLKSALIARLSGARRVVGFSKAGISERGANWFYSKYCPPEPGLSAIQRNRRLVAFSLGTSAKNPPRFGIVLPDLANQLVNVTRVFLIPCASRRDKLWDKEYWLQLIDALAAERPMLIWGTEGERQYVQELVSLSGGKATTLPMRQPIRDLAYQFRQAALVVGVDSGLPHLANAIGTPTILIFTRTHPRLFFSAGNILSRALGKHEQPPLPQEVIAAATKILGSTPEKVQR